MKVGGHYCGLHVKARNFSRRSFPRVQMLGLAPESAEPGSVYAFAFLCICVRLDCPQQLSIFLRFPLHFAQMASQFNLADVVRPNILDLTPYRCARDVRDILRRDHLNCSECVCFCIISGL